jgi:hypothetical protein
MHEPGFDRWLGIDRRMNRPAFSDLQASIRYAAGLVLRLARVKRYRDDKRVEDAATMASVRGIYAAQAGVER